MLTPSLSLANKVYSISAMAQYSAFLHLMNLQMQLHLLHTLAYVKHTDENRWVVS